MLRCVFLFLLFRGVGFPDLEVVAPLFGGILFFYEGDSEKAGSVRECGSRIFESMPSGLKGQHGNI